MNIAYKYTILISCVVFFSFPSAGLFVEVESSQCNFRSFSLSNNNCRCELHFHRSNEDSTGRSTVIFADRSTFLTFVGAADVQSTCHAACEDNHCVGRKNNFVSNHLFFVVIGIDHFRFQFESSFFFDRKNCYFIDFCQSSVSDVFLHGVNHLLCLCRSDLDIRSCSFQYLVD